MKNSKPTDAAAVKPAAKTTVKSEVKSEAKPAPTGKAPTGKAPTGSARSAASKTTGPKKPIPAKSTAQQTPVKKSGGGKGILAFVFVAAVIGGSFTVGWPYVGPLVSEKYRPGLEDIRKRLGLAQPQQLASTAAIETVVAPVIAEPATVAEAIVAPVAPIDPYIAAPVEQAPALMSEPDLPPEPEAPILAAGPDLSGLSGRLNDLEGQLSTYSNADGQAALAATQDISRVLAALKSEISALNARLDQMDASLKDLNDRPSGQAPGAVPAQALVLAATQLRVRLMTDAPFGAELSALEGLAAGDENVMSVVNRLKPHAEAGVPSKADLTARFVLVARDIVRAGSASGDTGWIGTVKDSLSGLVTIRRTDPNKISNDLDRSVAQAEAALQMGDLKSAVQTLSGLQGKPGEAVAAWLGDAQARLDSETALNALYNQALAAMAQVGGA